MHNELDKSWMKIGNTLHATKKHRRIDAKKDNGILKDW